MLDSLQATGMCNLKAQKIVVLPHKVAIAPFPAQLGTVLLLISIALTRKGEKYRARS